MSWLREPLLSKPAPNWSHDLPGPNEAPFFSQSTSVPLRSPNHVDDIYLELSRATLRKRGVSLWMSIVLAPFVLVSPLLFIETLYSGDEFTLILILGMVLAFVAPLWIVVYSWRMDTAAPRDEPIRFNRARRKVYVYRFYHNSRHPFGRAGWFIRAEAYEWDNLRAEACSIYGAMGAGGLIEVVSLAVVEPGTTKVIDRFHFAHGGLEAKMCWAVAQRYMQQGAQHLPEFDYPARDWNNEDVTFNLARYLAPKVQWPEAMDRESRTAP